MVNMEAMVNDSISLYQGLKQAEDESQRQDPIVNFESPKRDEVLRNFAKQLFAKIETPSLPTDNFFSHSKTKFFSFYDLIKKFLRLFSDLRHSTEAKLLEEAKDFYDKYLLQTLEGNFIDTLQFHSIEQSTNGPIYKFHPKSFHGHEFLVSIKPFQAHYEDMKILQITDVNSQLAFQLASNRNGRGNKSFVAFSDLHGKGSITNLPLENLSAAAQKKVFALIE